MTSSYKMMSCIPSSISIHTKHQLITEAFCRGYIRGSEHAKLFLSLEPADGGPCLCTVISSSDSMPLASPDHWLSTMRSMPLILCVGGHLPVASSPASSLSKCLGSCRAAALAAPHRLSVLKLVQPVECPNCPVSNVKILEI